MWTQTLNRRLPCVGKVAQRYSGWKRQIRFIQKQHKRDKCSEIKLGNILKPKLFSEKMQWRKLFDASTAFRSFSDRVAVRAFVADRGFAGMLVPQLWVGADPHLIPFDDLPGSFVLKSSHASGQVIIVRNDESCDRQAIIRQASTWLEVCYGTQYCERGYLGVPRRLVVEPLLTCRDGTPPMELKIFVYDGAPRIFQYNEIDRNKNYKIGYLDENWQFYQWKTTLKSAPDRPEGLGIAVQAACALCKDFDHCRVDFYFADETVYIGEITPYTFSGMVTLDPPEVDMIMGSFWKLKFPTLRALVTMISSDWGAL